VNTRQHQGFIYEAMFKVLALRRMFDVLEPSTVQPYDLVVECPTGLVKVQVKGSNYLTDASAVRMKLSEYKTLPDFTTLYDVLACYAQPFGCWYILPTYLLKTRTVRFYENPKKISKWEQYKDNWSPFYQKEKGET